MTLVSIGSDRVYVERERVVIHASEPMDWPIREYCRVPILFQGSKYHLRSKRTGEQPCKCIYELWPWPPELHEESPRVILYDEAYVIDRDRAAANGRHRDWANRVLLPLYPFLGLFWSHFKNRFLGPLGFEPGSITKASIVLTFNLFFAQGIFVGWLAGGILTYFVGFSALRPADWLLLLVLGADTTMRFGQTLKFDVQDHWGFCEWLWPRNKTV